MGLGEHRLSNLEYSRTKNKSIRMPDPIGPTRKNYGEPRWQGLGLVHGRLMVVAYTKRDSNTIRIISLRKANSREKILFQETLKDQLGKN
jgi:uncharacterized DUF497 family protein